MTEHMETKGHHHTEMLISYTDAKDKKLKDLSSELIKTKSELLETKRSLKLTTDKLELLMDCVNVIGDLFHAVENVKKRDEYIDRYQKLMKLIDVNKLYYYNEKIYIKLSSYVIDCHGDSRYIIKLVQSQEDIPETNRSIRSRSFDKKIYISSGKDDNNLRLHLHLPGWKHDFIRYSVIHTTEPSKIMSGLHSTYEEHFFLNQLRSKDYSACEHFLLRISRK